MQLRKILVAATVLAALAMVWRRVRHNVTVDAAPPPTPAATALDDVVSAAVGTPS